jgi:hypothetical protein
MTSDFQVDRSTFSVVALSEADDESAYWLAKTPPERLRAIELIRQAIYGYTSSTGRLQRVLEIATQREKGLNISKTERCQRSR